MPIWSVLSILFALLFSSFATIAGNGGTYPIWVNGYDIDDDGVIRNDENTDVVNDLLAQKDWVLGGQVTIQWKEVETSEGIYNFEQKIAEKAQRYIDAGKPFTLQLNAKEHPDYLFTKVPYTANGERLDKTVHVDEMGTLMYWHANYVDRHKALIDAFANYLRNKPVEYRSQLLGIRLNYNAISTEKYVVPADCMLDAVSNICGDGGTIDFTKADRWFDPVAGALMEGVSQGDWDSSTGKKYRQRIIAHYIDAFEETPDATPSYDVDDPDGLDGSHTMNDFDDVEDRTIVPLFVRNIILQGNNLFYYCNKFDPLIRDYIELKIQEGTLSLFHTSSEVQPRAESYPDDLPQSCTNNTLHTKDITDQPIPLSQYEVFERWCPYTTCYAEPWANSEGNHGADDTDGRPIKPVQWNYWRHLADLHMGVDYIANYFDNDLAWRISQSLTPIVPGDPGIPGIIDEYLDTYRFAERYAGKYRVPETAPGAWIAFREGYCFKGDYEYLMQQSGAMSTEALSAQRLYDNVNGCAASEQTEIDISLSDDLGPESQRYGAWARRLAMGNTLDLSVDNTFANSLSGDDKLVSVTYLDNLLDKNVSVEVLGQQFSVSTTGSGQWETETFLVPHDVSTSNTPISLSSNDMDLTLHMVEVGREAAIVNGSFDQGETDWTLQNASIDNSVGALHVQSDDSVNSGSQLDKLIPVVGGMEYRLSAWAWGNGLQRGTQMWQTFGIKSVFLDEDGVKIPEGYFDLPFLKIESATTLPREYHEKVYKAPQNAASLKISLVGLIQQATGEGWVDDIKLERVANQVVAYKENFDVPPGGLMGDVQSLLEPGSNNRYMSISSDDSNSDNFPGTQLVDIKPNTQYRLSAMAKSSNLVYDHLDNPSWHAFAIKAQFLDDQQSLLSYLTLTFPEGTQTDWQYHSIDKASPEGARYLKLVQIGVLKTATGTGDIDDIQLTEIVE